MCFSALSSFTGGAIISLIGLATIRANQERSCRLLAAVPFVFGLQQISEGFVWRALQAPGQATMLKMATTIFLIAAVVIWPTMMPLALLHMERQPRKRTILLAFLVVGVAVSLSHAIGLLLYEVTAQISSYHILYTMGSPRPLAIAASIGYLIATVPPLFISSSRRMFLFGVIIVLAYAATQIFYQAYLVSVWCFFAALASAVIWWIIKDPYSQKSLLQPKQVTPSV